MVKSLTKKIGRNTGIIPALLGVMALVYSAGKISKALNLARASTHQFKDFQIQDSPLEPLSNGDAITPQSRNTFVFV